MGLIQSVFCSMTFCIERVLTWTCCAFVLILLMFTLIILMIYGISVGYHYAQKELAGFAMSSRSTTEENTLETPNVASQPVVRLVADIRSELDGTPRSMLDVYQTKKIEGPIYFKKSESPVVVFQTERPPIVPELLPHERELARRLIGRLRRSRRNITSAVPVLRPVRPTKEKSTKCNTSDPVSVDR